LCNSLGATVIANGRDVDKLKSAKIKSAYPEKFILEPHDLVQNLDTLPQWTTELRQKYGKLSGLACCAGIAQIIPIREYTRQDAANIFDIDFHVPMLLVRGFSDRRNNIGKGSSIVLISSAAAIAKESGLAAYGGAKAALQAAVRSLSRELSPGHMRINAIAPGIVQTQMGKAYLDMLDEESQQREIAAYPFGLGEPQDVAGMAAFLLSSAGKWMTGQTIVMDGGRY
jgi:NAD(P)-dependent dehydrogenase (short-subunit alcohol dehydrogenase family)